MKIARDGRRWVEACVGDACPLAILTRTEYRALVLAASGWSNERIGARLDVDRREVAQLLRRARESVGASGERGLIAWYWYSIALGAAQRIDWAMPPPAPTRLRPVS